MTDTAAPSVPGAFLQLIEYRTTRPEAMPKIIEQWVAAIGAERSARWYVTTADRGAPDVYVQLVEFASYDDAMVNSDHPATAEFAAALHDICDGEPTFRNLGVIDSKLL